MNTKINEIFKCEVCGNKKLLSVLNLGLHPMCDDLVRVDDERVAEERLEDARRRAGHHRK